jgi:oligopeptidase A
MASDNPLLDTGFTVPFDRIQPSHVMPAVETLLREAEIAKERIADASAPTYDETMLGLDALTARLDDAMGVVSLLEACATTPELRAAYNEAQPLLSDFYSRIALSAPLYAKIRTFAETAEAKSLGGARRRFFEKTLSDFRRAGAELDDAGKETLAALDVDLTKATLAFSQNVLDSTNAFELLVDDPTVLAGMPEDAIMAAKESAARKGLPGYRLTLQAPSYMPAMTYMENADLRRRLWRAYNTRATQAPFDNRPLLREILRLRRKKANLLGYKTFADLVLEDRMAKSGEKARTFVQTLTARSTPFFAKENDELRAYKRELTGKDEPLEPWDIAFYAEKLRRARYDFDEEALRDYFPFEGVLGGLFRIAEHLYGVKIEAWDDAPVWHDTVRAFRVNGPDGSWAAAFYVDAFPRESKRDGAWMQGLFTGNVRLRGDARHLGVFAANVTPPVGDKPALLRHREVETLFHEFGHLLHHVLSEVDIRSIAGTNVAWDFVELPSMIMENWAWERDALDLFAKHYKSGEIIPADLFERMKRARTFRAAYQMMRQLGFAEVDLALHMDFDPESGDDPVQFARKSAEIYSPVPFPDDYAMIAAFGHLFSSPVGYAAGYYSYKWAEVLEADAFTRFRHEGLLSRDIGTSFWRSILSRGDSMDPAILYREFMGRDPDPQAMFQRAGLV